MATPQKGQARVKITVSGKQASYGYAGRAKGGGICVRPPTQKVTPIVPEAPGKL